MCGGITFAIAASGADNNGVTSSLYLATHTSQLGDPTGPLDCDVTGFTDLAGNAGSAAFNTANECKINVVAETVSPSPTPTASIAIQAAMYTASGQCVTDGCVNAHPSDPTTIRVAFGIERTLVLNAANPTDIPTCLSLPGGGVGFNAATSQLLCVSNIATADATDWSPSDFTLNRLTSNGPSPGFEIEPVVTAPGVHPNTISPSRLLTSLAALVNCSGLAPSSPLRWTMRYSGGPCYIDPLFPGYSTCSPGGIFSSNQDYTDQDGNTMGIEDVYRDIFCPT